jgi:hypothetical protein
MAAHGGGLGFSFIAEAYLNFGWTGAPLILALIGLAMSWLFHWAESSADPARKAVMASFLSFFLLYARGESATCVRAMVWYSLVPYLVVCLLSRRENLKARSRAHFEPRLATRPGGTRASACVRRVA